MAKEYHPDSSSNGGDAQKFQKAHEAYQSLLAKAKEWKKSQKALNGSQFQFLSQTQNGLDIYYDLAMTKSEGDGTLTIPKSGQEVCPHCLGSGRTLVLLNHGSIYRPTVCPHCLGSGKLERTRQIKVKVTPEMAATGKIRLKGAGGRDEKSGQKGDLYLYFPPAGRAGSRPRANQNGETLARA
jgi:DnaJ-class molecular chaperone